MREIGIENYFEMLAKGENVTKECGGLAALGIYLMHGGKTEDFMNMTDDEIQLIVSTYTAYNRKISLDVINGLIELLNEMGKRRA